LRNLQSFNHDCCERKVHALRQGRRSGNDANNATFEKSFHEPADLRRQPGMVICHASLEHRRQRILISQLPSDVLAGGNQKQPIFLRGHVQQIGRGRDLLGSLLRGSGTPRQYEDAAVLGLTQRY
jgi:hypothetical protein